MQTRWSSPAESKSSPSLLKSIELTRSTCSRRTRPMPTSTTIGQALG